MKKFLNALYICLAILGGIWLNMQILFKGILPLPPVQHFLQEKISSVSGRSVTFEQLRFSLLGFSVNQLQVASGGQETTEDDFLRLEKLHFQWRPWHLLHGHIKVRSIYIKGLDVFIVRHSDGSFNFSSGKSQKDSIENNISEDKTYSQPLDIRFNLGHLRLEDSHFRFVDELTGRRAEATDVFVDVGRLRLDRPFPISINADLFYKNPSWPLQSIELGITLWPHLQNLDLNAAGVHIKRLVLKHEGGIFILGGDVKNFQTPSVMLDLSAENISEKLIRFARPDMPLFTIPQVQLHLAAMADLTKSSVNVSSFTVNALDSFLSLSGRINQTPQFEFLADGSFGANLAAIGQAAEILKPYELGGVVQGMARASQSEAQADFSLQDVAFYEPNIGHLRHFNTRVQMPNLHQVDLEKIEGILNDGTFEGSLALRHAEQALDADVKFYSARLALPSRHEKEPSAVSAATAQPQEKTAWPLPPLNVRADVKVDSLDAPFIYGKDIHFSANMQNITPALSQAHGNLSLRTGTGEIKDLNKLTNANALTKVMFSSLKVVSDVINSLNVFGVLNSIALNSAEALTRRAERPDDMVVQTVLDENGKEIQIMIPHQDEKIDGRWAFEEFSTDVSFNNGVADVSKGSFVSDMLSFNLQGEMNFQTQALDMKVNAAPGRHYEGGIMPLTLDIGGTMSAPQGKMNVSSSVFSTVTQGVGNNVVSRTIKKIFSGIGSLFKGNEKEEDPK